MIEAASYRVGFIESCLETAPAPARSWYEDFCEVVHSEVRPWAAAVDRDARYPHEATAALRKIGGFGITIGEQESGLGFGDAMAALAVETVAAACPSTAAVMMFHYQVVRRTNLYGLPSWRSADLAKLASGEWLASSAWTELGAGADKSCLATRMTCSGEQLRINGAKHFCTGLEGNSLVHVLLDASPAGANPQATFARVPTGLPGVDLSDIYPLLGLRGSSTGTISFHDVQVDEDCVIGGIGNGGKLMHENHLFLMNPGLLALGVGCAAFEAARAGALGLEDGSRNITGIQSVRFKLANMETQLARAYALAQDAVRLLAPGHARFSSDFLRVKLVASEMAVAVASDTIRLAGGRGFHARWPYERYLRDAYATILMGPTNEIIKERIAEHLLNSGAN